MGLFRRAVTQIRIHCPVASETLAALMAGDLEAIERDPTSAAMLAIIRADNPLGDFGLYQGVFETAFGLEGFIPAVGARPTLGAAGAATLSPTVTITTYAAAEADPAAVNAAIEALVHAHPWEIPVIEVAQVELAG